MSNCTSGQALAERRCLKAPQSNLIDEKLIQSRLGHQVPHVVACHTFPHLKAPEQALVMGWGRNTYVSNLENLHGTCTAPG